MSVKIKVKKPKTLANDRKARKRIWVGFFIIVALGSLFQLFGGEKAKVGIKDGSSKIVIMNLTNDDVRVSGILESASGSNPKLSMVVQGRDGVEYEHPEGNLVRIGKVGTSLLFEMSRLAQMGEEVVIYFNGEEGQKSSGKVVIKRRWDGDHWTIIIDDVEE